jgi:hypothetical protein
MSLALKRYRITCPNLLQLLVPVYKNGPKARAQIGGGGEGVFEKKVLRRIFVPRRQDGENCKLSCKILHFFYKSATVFLELLPVNAILSMVYF